MSLRVIGIRHGEVHNPDGVIYAGLTGYGLSEFGRRQASEVAAALRGSDVVAVYASPLDRAIQTAGAVAEAVGAEVIPDERLHEWRYEEGREAWDAYHDDPGAVTSGESLAELGDRMESWLTDVRARHERGIVVGVSHLEPLRAILLRLTERPAKDLFQITIDLAQAVRLHPDPDPAPRPADELVG